MTTEAERIVVQLKRQLAHNITQPTYESLIEKYGEPALYAAVYDMETKGGHFASCIAKAFYYADSNNRSHLFAAFGYLFERFIREGDRNNE